MLWAQIGIIGKSGTGKSFLTNKILSKLNSDRIICIDDHKQFKSIHKSKQYFRCESIESFIEMIVDADKFNIICSFTDFSDYSYLFALIWKLNNFVLVIDEISLFADSFNIDLYLKEIILRGRLKNICVIWNTQRPALINRTVFSQLTDLIAFQIFDVRDIIYLPKTWQKQESVLSNQKRGEYKVLMDSGAFKNFF